MRRFLLFSTLLQTLATLSACVTTSDSPTLYVGMSRDRLKSHFGEPLRVEPTRSGGEDWYYTFTSWSPNIDASTDNDGVSRSASVSMTISDQNSTHDCPVHLSPGGYVVEPLPSGRIVRK